MAFISMNRKHETARLKFKLKNNKQSHAAFLSSGAESLKCKTGLRTAACRLEVKLSSVIDPAKVRIQISGAGEFYALHLLEL